VQELKRSKNNIQSYYFMKTYITILLVVVHFCQLHALDFYWKGGNGDFNDPQKWAIGSLNGGTALQAPISTDNVHFLASAVNIGGSVTVTINTNANCHDFFVDSAINTNSTLVFSAGINQTLDVYGSMILSSSVHFDFRGILRFRSIKNGAEVIQTAGNHFQLVRIEFDGGLNTEWILQDSLVVDDYQLDSDNWDWIIPTGSIVLYNGTINSNKQTIVTDFFYSKNNSANRGIMFDSSEVYLTGYNGGDSKCWWIDFSSVLGNYNSFSAKGAHFRFVQTAGKKQYGFFGEGIQYDSITANYNLSIGGYTVFNYLKTNSSTYFVDAQCSVDDLILSPSHEHFFNSNNLVNNDFLEVDSFHVPNNCSDFITLRGFAKSTGLLRSKHSGELELNQVILQDMNCDTSGQRTYIVRNGINGGGNSSAWIFQATNTSKMKFVDGGNQRWSDPNNWQVWNGTAWGTNTLNCMPTPFVDIYIDGTSFPFSNKWIDVDVIGNCRKIYWESTSTPGSTFHLSKELHVFGAVELFSTMGAIIGSEVMYFHGLNDSLTSSGVNLNKVVFWKHADYFIADNLHAVEVHGWLYSTIRGNNISINTNVFSLGNRVLDSVVVNIVGTFYDFGATILSYTGNTTFNFVETAGAVDIRTQKEYAYSNSVYLPNVRSAGVRLQFNGIETFVMGNLELLGDAQLRVNDMRITGSMPNYTGKLILHPGNFCDIKSVEIADSLIAKGTCNEMITIRPYQSTVGTIQMGAMAVESCFIQGMNNVGVTAYTISSIDGGGNNGWSFNTGLGLVYYWRASAIAPNDYTGNWSNPNHWTTDASSAVGSLGGCMPTLSDTVIFDNMSFSQNSNGCNIDNTAFCKTFLCLADITITGDQLYVGGSFVLYNNMTNYNQTGVIYFVGNGVNTISLNNTRLSNCGVVFNNPTGEWLLEDDFYLHDSVPQCYTGFVLDAGVFRANGHRLTIRSRFRADRTSDYRALDIRNSVVDLLCNDRYNTYYGLTWDISNSVGMQIFSENSTLNFKNNTSSYNFTKFFYMGDGLVYDKVNFLDNNNYMKVYDDAIYNYAYFEGTATVYGNNTFDSVALVGGHHWYIDKGKTQILAPGHGKIISYGNASDFVYIESTVAGNDAYIHKEYGNAFCVDYVKIKDIRATKGPFDPINASRHLALFFETGENSDNINGSATGVWAFSLPPAVTVAASHDTLVEFCNGGLGITVPISFTGTYPYSVILDWYNDAGNSGLDTFYFQDDDNDVTTVCSHFLDLYPTSNTYYIVDVAGVRCGERSFNAPVSYLNALVHEGVLVDQESYGECTLNNGVFFTHFFDVQTERPIASIQDNISSIDTIELGLVQMKAHFDAIPGYWNGIPYLPRHWTANSFYQGAGKVRLYFSKIELDALSIAYFGRTGMSVGADLILLQFSDTIGIGAADTISYTVVPLTGINGVPFSTINDVFAIEFETNKLGAYMLMVKELSVLFPLDLLTFNATKKGQFAAVLSWTTAQEINIKEFIVERSEDAIYFEPVATIASQLNLDYNYYSIQDSQPNIPNSYYRLKIVGTDGKTSYSPIRSLLFHKPIDDVKIIPNPADESTFLTLKLDRDEDFRVEVHSINAQKKVDKLIKGQKGVQRVQINTQEWISGLYIIALISENGEVLRQKLVVQH